MITLFHESYISVQAPLVKLGRKWISDKDFTLPTSANKLRRGQKQ